jgi:RHH-type proline utilization regulon transcriptional repressor/proline dehydrogenase/delta 1-pyrroline-5-carboxylate dehydrogenase
VVIDVVTSAFRSAGQRCSALRVLLLQEEIADRTLEMLAGAMETLVVGDPADPATDVGPVIDEGAYERLMAHREASRSRWIHTVGAPAEGLYVPPTLIGVDRVEDVKKEWFGPLLHVATWKSGRLAETVERVNRSGFGLTMGLHSRIARAAETVETLASVGNLYVNRSMIGAIVGSQPFGGEGLSGHRPQGRRPQLPPPLLRRTGDQHRHDQRRRQRDVAEPGGCGFVGWRHSSRCPGGNPLSPAGRGLG